MTGTTSSYALEAEIFSVGTWNGEAFTRADLEEIAANFTRLRGQLKPPLKFGHDEDQRLLGQRDGDPALGWVEGLRVVGDRLLARFAGLPRVVYDAVRAGRYRRVSAELYLDVRQGAKRLGKTLKAVALLGADLPAITTLADLTHYLGADGAQATAAGAAPLRFSFAGTGTFTCPAPTPLVHPAENAHMSSGNTGSTARSNTGGAASNNSVTKAALEAELAELRAFKAQQETAAEEEAVARGERARQSLRESARGFCEQQVRAGRLSPAQRSSLLAELDGQALRFSDSSELLVTFDWVRGFVRELPVRLPSAPVAHAAPQVEDTGGSDPSQQVARLANAKMLELNLSYSEAARYVLQTHPELARAYRDYTLTFHSQQPQEARQ